MMAEGIRATGKVTQNILAMPYSSTVQLPMTSSTELERVQQALNTSVYLYNEQYKVYKTGEGKYYYISNESLYPVIEADIIPAYSQPPTELGFRLRGLIDEYSKTLGLNMTLGSAERLNISPPLRTMLSQYIYSNISLSEVPSAVSLGTFIPSTGIVFGSLSQPSEYAQWYLSEHQVVSRALGQDVTSLGFGIYKTPYGQEYYVSGDQLYKASMPSNPLNLGTSPSMKDISNIYLESGYSYNPFSESYFKMVQTPSTIDYSKMLAEEKTYFNVAQNPGVSIVYGFTHPQEILLASESLFLKPLYEGMTGKTFVGQSYDEYSKEFMGREINWLKELQQPNRTFGGYLDMPTFMDIGKNFAYGALLALPFSIPVVGTFVGSTILSGIGGVGIIGEGRQSAIEGRPISMPIAFGSELMVGFGTMGIARGAEEILSNIKWTPLKMQTTSVSNVNQVVKEGEVFGQGTGFSKTIPENAEQLMLGKFKLPISRDMKMVGGEEFAFYAKAGELTETDITVGAIKQMRYNIFDRWYFDATQTPTFMAKIRGQSIPQSIDEVIATSGHLGKGTISSPLATSTKNVFEISGVAEVLALEEQNIGWAYTGFKGISTMIGEPTPVDLSSIFGGSETFATSKGGTITFPKFGSNAPKIGGQEYELAKSVYGTTGQTFAISKEELSNFLTTKQFKVATPIQGFIPRETTGTFRGLNSVLSFQPVMASGGGGKGGTFLSFQKPLEDFGLGGASFASFGTNMPKDMQTTSKITSTSRWQNFFPKSNVIEDVMTYAMYPESDFASEVKSIRQPVRTTMTMQNLNKQMNLGFENRLGQSQQLNLSLQNQQRLQLQSQSQSQSQQQMNMQGQSLQQESKQAQQQMQQQAQQLNIIPKTTTVIIPKSFTPSGMHTIPKYSFVKFFPQGRRVPRASLVPRAGMLSMAREMTKNIQMGSFKYPEQPRPTKQTKRRFANEIFSNLGGIEFPTQGMIEQGKTTKFQTGFPNIKNIMPFKRRKNV